VGLNEQNLSRRIVTAAAGVPVLLVAAWLGRFVFLAVVNLMILAGLWEFYRMMEAKGARPYKGIGILSGLALSWYVFFRSGVYSNLFLTLVLLLIMLLELSRRNPVRAVFHISSTIFGVLYVSWLGSHLILLRELPELRGMDYFVGFKCVVLTLILVWTLDTSAYFVGNAFGRRPLLERVSPSKTIEGAVGGLVAAVIVAVVSKYTFAGFLGLHEAVAVGVIASIFGQMGDLVESLIKRDVMIKDTSAALPGHGGILDRFDSLLFAAPLVYYFLKFVVFR
jgi:phosphatidate cytidylyltransferase